MTWSETYYCNGYDTKVKMRDLSLHRDSQGYYLTASYDIDDRESTRLLELPKIRLGVNERAVICGSGLRSISVLVSWILIMTGLETRYISPKL